MPDVDFIRPCGVVAFCFDLFPLGLVCGECYFGCLQFVCFPIYVSVCFVCFMFGCVGERVCDPSVCLGVPSICQICVFV